MTRALHLAAVLGVMAVFLSGCGDADAEYICFGDGHVKCRGASKLCGAATKQCADKVRSVGVPTFNMPAFRQLAQPEQKRRKALVMTSGELEQMPVNLKLSSTAVAKLKGGGSVGLVALLGGLLLLAGLVGLAYFAMKLYKQRQWQACSGTEDRTFFYNKKTGESSWNGSKDWVSMVDRFSGKTYYVNGKTGQTQWQKP